MRIGITIVALLCLAASASFAQLTDYTQDFEGLAQASPTGLSDDGWLVFGLDPNGGYGPFPAPNGGPAFSGIDIGQGGPPQGDQQLVVYNDYNNPFHGSGGQVEANVFQEQTIAEGDGGKTCTFAWQHKKGNIEAPTTALAFIKVLDPNTGFPLIAFPSVDTSNLPVDWDGDQIQIVIDPAWEPNNTGPLGFIFQFGYNSTTSNFTPSGNFYDNISFTCEGAEPVPASGNIALVIFLVLLAGTATIVIARSVTRRTGATA